jgi:Ca2+-binding EF-hand superfamily protein
MNYERIRDELIRLDNFRNGTINSNDMRSLIEDLLEFQLRPDEYYQLFKQFPIDENGKIKYKDYLKQVMDHINAAQQQQQQQQQQKSPAYVLVLFLNILIYFK